GAAGSCLAYRRRLIVHYHDRLATGLTGVPARIVRMPGHRARVSVPALRRAGVAILLHCRSTARVTRCWCRKGRTGRAFNGPAGPSLAYRRRLVVHYHDRLATGLTGVPARIVGMPGDLPCVSVPTLRRAGVAVLLHRRSTAGVTRCWRRKGRTGRALNGAAGPCLAYRWRLIVYHHD